MCNRSLFSDEFLLSFLENGGIEFYIEVTRLIEMIEGIDEILIEETKGTEEIEA